MNEAAKASPPPRRVFRSVSSVNLALKRQVAEAQRLEKQQVAAQLRNQVKVSVTCVVVGVVVGKGEACEQWQRLDLSYGRRLRVRRA